LALQATASTAALAKGLINLFIEFIG